jgi:hypothetical protein
VFFLCWIFVSPPAFGFEEKWSYCSYLKEGNKERMCRREKRNVWSARKFFKGLAFLGAVINL